MFLHLGFLKQAGLLNFSVPEGASVMIKINIYGVHRTEPGRWLTLHVSSTAVIIIIIWEE